jgi:hypothetical protein
MVMTAAAGASVSSPIEACGDKFMLTGGLMSFDQVYRARYPGAVLIYSPGGAAKTDYTKLQTLLTRVGHKVTLVREANQIDSTVSAIKADVVVTPFADAGTIGRQAQSGPTAPAILPVLATGNKVEKAACKQQPYACELKAADGPEKFILAVNETMTGRTKARSKSTQSR